MIHFVVMLPSCYEASVISKPRNGAFDFPSAPVTSQCSTVLGLGFASPLAMGSHKFNALFLEFFAKTIRVIRFVTYQSLRSFTKILNRFMGHFHFRWTGRVKGHSQGIPWLSASTMSFEPLPRLVFPTLKPLF